MQKQILLFILCMFGFQGCNYIGFPDKETVKHDVQYYLDENYPDIPLRVIGVQNLANTGSMHFGSFRVMVADPQGIKLFLYWENGSKSTHTDIRQEYNTSLRETALCALFSRLLSSGIKADVFLNTRLKNRPVIDIICMTPPTETNREYLIAAMGEAIRETNAITNTSYPGKVYFTWQGTSRGKNRLWHIDAEDNRYYNTYLSLELDSAGIASPYYPEGPAAEELEEKIRAQLPEVSKYSSPEFYRIQQQHLSEIFLLYEVTKEQYISVIATLEGEIKEQEIIDIPSTGTYKRREELEYLIPEGFRHAEIQTKNLFL